jgi:hypothetical protein
MEVQKTKILIFSKGRIPNNLKFQIDNNDIGIVKDYIYLGIFFARSGSFLTTRKYLQEKATKAIYGLLQ